MPHGENIQNQTENSQKIEFYVVFESPISEFDVTLIGPTRSKKFSALKKTRGGLSTPDRLGCLCVCRGCF